MANLDFPGKFSITHFVFVLIMMRDYLIVDNIFFIFVHYSR